jgi:formylmethanofuran dehydrogenase subunit E
MKRTEKHSKKIINFLIAYGGRFELTELKDKEPWKKEDMVLTCQHCIEGSRQPEYHKEDDSYVCSKCRDSMRDDGFKTVEPLLHFIHRNHFTNKELPSKW